MATINWTIELLQDVTLDSDGNGEFIAKLSRAGALIDPNFRFTGKATDAQAAASAKMIEYELQLKEANKFKAGTVFTIPITI